MSTLVTNIHQVIWPAFVATVVFPSTLLGEGLFNGGVLFRGICFAFLKQVVEER